jgi:hypothetical protein
VYVIRGGPFDASTGVVSLENPNPSADGQFGEVVF